MLFKWNLSVFTVIPPIDSVTNHLRDKAAYQIPILIASFTLMYFDWRSLHFFIYSFILFSVREWPMFIKTIFQVCFFLGGLIMPSFSINFKLTIWRDLTTGLWTAVRVTSILGDGAGGNSSTRIAKIMETEGIIIPTMKKLT